MSNEKTGFFRAEKYVCLDTVILQKGEHNLFHIQTKAKQDFFIQHFFGRKLA